MAGRILVVDDEKELRETLTDFLRDQGYDTLAAEDGLAAKKILLVKKFDLVLTDMRMPNMSGAELLQFTKSIPDSPKVVIITGYSDVSREEFLRQGAVGFLNKPFSVKHLIDVVRSLVPNPT